MSKYEIVNSKKPASESATDFPLKQARIEEEKRVGKTHCTTNNKYSLLFVPGPLQNLVCALRQRVPARMRASHTVEFEERRHPRQGNRIAADAVVDF